jgi:hypothetical protein
MDNDARAAAVETFLL